MGLNERKLTPEEYVEYMNGKNWNMLYEYGIDEEQVRSCVNNIYEYNRKKKLSCEYFC